MAGATLPYRIVLRNPGKVFYKQVPIKSAEVINEGDLVNIDTNGQVVVASKTQGAVVKASWIAFFNDENGMEASRTGVAALTVKTGLCKKADIVLDATGYATHCPSVNEGLPVFLGPVPTTASTYGVTNYTCARSTTANDLIQEVGFVGTDLKTLHIDLSSTRTETKRQNAANTTVELV